MWNCEEKLCPCLYNLCPPYRVFLLNNFDAASCVCHPLDSIWYSQKSPLHLRTALYPSRGILSHRVVSKLNVPLWTSYGRQAYDCRTTLLRISMCLVIACMQDPISSLLQQSSSLYNKISPSFNYNSPSLNIANPTLLRSPASKT